MALLTALLAPAQTRQDASLVKGDIFPPSKQPDSLAMPLNVWVAWIMYKKHLLPERGEKVKIPTTSAWRHLRFLAGWNSRS